MLVCLLTLLFAMHSINNIVYEIKIKLSCEGTVEEKMEFYLLYLLEDWKMISKMSNGA